MAKKSKACKVKQNIQMKRQTPYFTLEFFYAEINLNFQPKVKFGVFMKHHYLKATSITRFELERVQKDIEM